MRRYLTDPETAEKRLSNAELCIELYNQAVERGEVEPLTKKDIEKIYCMFCEKMPNPDGT